MNFIIMNSSILYYYIVFTMYKIMNHTLRLLHSIKTMWLSMNTLKECI